MSAPSIAPASSSSSLVSGYDEVVSRLPQPAWFAPARAKALRALTEHGFPTRRDERWKYTDISPLLAGNYTPAPLATPPEAFFEGVQRFELDCHRIVFVNGVYRRNLSDHESVAGLRLQSLNEALEHDAPTLRNALAARGEVGGFAALNTAYLHDGVLIEVADGTVVDKPVHLIFLSVAHEPAPVAAQPRIVIAAGRNSELRVIESHLGLENAANFTNVVADIQLDAGANVRQLRLIEAGKDEFHISNVHARVERDARYVNHQICLAGRLVRNDIQVDLAAEGGECELNGFVLAGGSDHVDNHLDVRHLAPRTNSQQFYRAVLDGRARGVFNGKVYVAKNAQKIDAQQASNNLLLSKLAEIDTKPELEIYADDVKCSHGATVGQLDDDMLFYLRSRGIDAETARGLLIFAFADDVIRRIGVPQVRTHVEDAVVTRLPDSDRLKEFVA